MAGSSFNVEAAGASGNEKLLKEGYMVKRAQGKNKVLARFHLKWQQRWFVLTDRILSYYTNPSKKEHKGNVMVAQIKRVDRVPQEDFNRPFLIAVHYGQDEEKLLILYMQTVSDKDMVDWIERLNEAIEMASQGRMTRQHSVTPNNSPSGGKDRALPDIPPMETQQALQTTTRSTFMTPSNGSSSSSNNNSSNTSRMTLRGGAHETNIHLQLENPDYFLAVVLHTFKSRMEGELTVTESDSVVVLDAEDVDWWKVRDHRGNSGYVPANYIAPAKSLEKEPYFHGIMTREEATSLLKAQGINGSFLLRESANDMGRLSLSIKCDTVIRHYRINSTPTGALYIAERATFASVHELIMHYQRNRDGLPVRLLYPVQNKNTPTLKTLSHDKDIWEIKRSELTFDMEIGSGQFGAVHRGTWRGTTQVAIKVVKEDCVSYEEFLSEANVMKRMAHPNLVKLLAVVTADEPMCIVTELMSNGNLLEFLRARMNTWERLNFDVMVYMSLQVANAMQYLEKENFIHRDLAARNVLVGDNNIVKVADFGLSRLVEEGYYDANEKSKFAVKWTAPEVVTMAKFSVKSDVWSYAVVLYETFTHGRTPYEGMGNKEVFDKVMNGYRLEQPDGCKPQIYELMIDCWLADPNERPSFAEIHRRLSNIVDDSPNDGGVQFQYSTSSDFDA